jgi:membrane fusion protein (multidrug efflux system)
VSVDPASGSVTLRAIFDNPSHLLLPGMYSTARLTQGVNKNAFLIPQQSVTRTPQGDATAYVVNSSGVVEVKTLKTAGTHGSNWIVTDGIQEGDRIIYEGVMKVRPGATVKTVPAQPGQHAGQPAAVGSAAPAAGGQAAPAEAQKQETKPEQKPGQKADQSNSSSAQS